MLVDKKQYQAASNDWHAIFALDASSSGMIECTITHVANGGPQDDANRLLAKAITPNAASS